MAALPSGGVMTILFQRQRGGQPDGCWGWASAVGDAAPDLIFIRRRGAKILFPPAVLRSAGWMVGVWSAVEDDAQDPISISVDEDIVPISVVVWLGSTLENIEGDSNSTAAPSTS